MPPKRNKPTVPLTDRVTRSRALSEGQPPQGESDPDQEPRPLSRASSTSTLVADSSNLSVWSIQDTTSELSFTSSIDVTSTQVLRLPDPKLIDRAQHDCFLPVSNRHVGYRGTRGRGRPTSKARGSTPTGNSSNHGRLNT